MCVGDGMGFVLDALQVSSHLVLNALGLYEPLMSSKNDRGQAQKNDLGGWGCVPAVSLECCTGTCPIASEITGPPEVQQGCGKRAPVMKVTVGAYELA